MENSADNSWRTRLVSQYHLLVKFFPYLWPSGKWGIRFRVLLSVVLLLVSKGVGIATPFGYKYAVDDLAIKGSAIPWLAILLYGLGRLISTLLQNLIDTTFLAVQQNALKDASVESFSHLYNLPLQFHITRKTGSLLQIVERGTRGMSSLCQFMLFNIFPLILELIMVLIILISKYIFWISLIVFIDIVIYVVFTIGVTEWRSKFRREMNEAENLANQKAVDGLLNYESIKYFGAENHEIKRYGEALDGYTRTSQKSQTSLAFLNVGQAAIIAVGQTGVMLLTAWQVSTGIITVGDFVLVNTFILSLYTPLNWLGTSYRLIKQSLVDMEQMFDLLKQEITIKDIDQPMDFKVSQGEIRFENVSFSYGKDVPVLKDISFTVKGGSQLAIVGASGSGKSTLSRLLFRFYDVTSGRIMIDGTDISMVRQNDLRSAIGIVPQDTVLFNDTIRYNIGYGNLGGDFSQITDAAKIAKIYNFIEGLPEGWETKVGERGLRLSGGEKQRVSIARAVLKNPPIMVFDEATSSLDTITEKDIQENLRDAFKGKTTTIILAHRLSTIIDSDHILVMNKGEIIEQGDHNTLLELNGEYKKLWEKQSQQITKKNEEII